MGYNIAIGNAKIDASPERNEITLTVEGAEHPDAPDHDKYVLKRNFRSPSYAAWHAFCETAGIQELFYGEGWDSEIRQYKYCSEGFHREKPLLMRHPGIQMICEADYEYVKAARIKREHTNGGKDAGFWDDEDVDNGKDNCLARLLWLEFWMRWALDNCEYPCLENS